VGVLGCDMGWKDGSIKMLLQSIIKCNSVTTAMHCADWRGVLAHKGGAVAIDAAHRRARDVVHGQDVTITPPAMLLQRLQLHRQRCCCDVHDCCFSAGAALLDAELVPHVTVAPLLHVDGNLKKKCQQKNSFTEQRHTGQEGAGGHVTWVPRGFVRTSTWALSVRGQCKGWRRDQTETQPSKNKHMNSCKRQEQRALVTHVSSLAKLGQNEL